MHKEASQSSFSQFILTKVDSKAIFLQVGKWVSSSDYRSAQPDPLRDFAEKLVNEINNNHTEDVNRFCNVYVDLNFQVSVNFMFLTSLFSSGCLTFVI